MCISANTLDEDGDDDDSNNPKVFCVFVQAPYLMQFFVGTGKESSIHS
jgi:hypothetical protein